ncbi:MAG: peroxiredoxin family protein [Methylocella sp.]
MIDGNPLKKEDRSLENSRINRNGLPRGVPAPLFCLPRLDGAKLSLDEYRGQRVLLVFSDPNCGPCDQLAPQLEHLHRPTTDLQVLMISRGDPEAIRVKAAQHELTFPIVLQRQWEISREYGIFATPVGYFIDEQGIIAADVAVGSEAILALVTGREKTMREQMQTRLEALRKEFETGQAEFEKVERQRTYLRETMLRISGAVQVLEELLAEGQPPRRDRAGPNELSSAPADEANARPAHQNLGDLPGTTQSQGTTQ